MPLAALLGAFRAELDLGIGAIGGKDSMSGTFENLDVPPTLVSFAVTTAKTGDILSGEFKKAGSEVRILKTPLNADGVPDAAALKENFAAVSKLRAEGKILAAYTPTYGGIAEAVYKMCIGNGIGFEFSEGTDEKKLFGYEYGAFVLETAPGTDIGERLGVTIRDEAIVLGGTRVPLEDISRVYEGKLESVYPVRAAGADNVRAVSYEKRSDIKPLVSVPAPRVLIPVFPGTNCEYDSAKAVERAGAKAEIFVINNLTPSGVRRSVEAFADKIKKANAIFIPGGFSGGDEPEGSGKFITAFFRNARISDAVEELLQKRDGLMLGVCNGFQALIKLGLVPYGKIMPEARPEYPTLTFNTIARHQSKIVITRVASVKSPWLMKVEVGDLIAVPVSHGEGRFVASAEVIEELIRNGQIATQYADLSGAVTGETEVNPNGSVMNVEGITSPDGRVFGKMGHSERYSAGLYKNVPARYDMGLFDSLVEYYK